MLVKETSNRVRNIRRYAAVVLVFSGVAIFSLLFSVSIQAQAPITLITQADVSMAGATGTPSPTSTPMPTWTYTPFCQLTISGSITTDDPVQMGILNAIHTPSPCQSPARPCPGVVDTIPRHYKVYPIYMSHGSFSTQCVNIQVQATGCAGNLYSATYSSFNPNDLCASYMGDIGDPVIGTASYEITAHRGSYFYVVVNEVTPGSGCSGFTITITPQNTCFITPTSTITSVPVTSTATSTPTATNTANPSPTCTAGWEEVPSQNVGTAENVLTDVSALAPNDVWAVGYYSSTTGYQTLTQHWDGAEWTTVPSPNPGAGSNNQLNGVKAIASNDVWAVGFYNQFAPRHLLTIHWDGTQWSVVPNPDPGGNYTNFLNAIDATASNDLWTVGFYRYNSPKELIMGWDGAEWSVEASPSTSLGNLADVDARTTDDAWAVGSVSSPSLAALIERWNGTNWSVVTGPEIVNPHALSGVAAISANDAWAVGSENVAGTDQSLIMHWNGTDWTQATTPDVGRLLGVAAVGPDDVWAVGTSDFLHWNGTAWSAVPNSVSGTLNGIDALSADDMWAVGSRSIGGVQRTLIQHYTTGCTTPIPTGTATLTPAIPTGTSTSIPSSVTTQTAEATQSVTTPPSSTVAATETVPSTVSATPTHCAIVFTDVEAGSTFYPYVRCLACRGIVEGYGDGTYRPGNPVTRGQAAKIVSNTAGWSDAIPPGQHTFNDVPPASTFWLYVERLYLHEAVGGYACGDEGEPCPGVYYRPGNSLTRGQIAKVVALSAGWSDSIPPSQQTFVDVLPASTFWEYIEQAVLHNVVNGYSDGTYRPQNIVTRGQMAKVAANTFYPECSTP